LLNKSGPTADTATHDEPEVVDLTTN